MNGQRPRLRTQARRAGRQKLIDPLSAKNGAGL